MDEDYSPSGSSGWFGSLLGYAFLAMLIYGGYFVFNNLKHSYEVNHPTEIDTTQHPRPCNMDHRFEKVEIYPPALRSAIALDSCTGKLCKTWSWVSTNKNSVYETYDGLPICSELPNVKP